MPTSKLLFIVLAVSSAVFASSLTFTVTDSGTSEPTGSTVGFGYNITNSTNFFYQPTSLNAGTFLAGSPNSLFDYPEVASNSSATETAGLFAVTLTGTPGQKDTGNFVLSGEFYSNSAETIDAGPAPNLIAAYSVTVSNAPLGTPQPGTLGFLILALGSLCAAPRR